MMKKTIAILLALILVMTAGTACAAGRLDAFTNRLKEAAQKQAAQGGAESEPEAPVETPIPDKSYGPAMTIDDPFFEKVRSSAYLQESAYSKEANVMIEVKNVSGRTLYPDDAIIRAMSATGEVLEEETYCYYGPEMVEDGDSLFVWEWFYGFDCELSQIDHFEVIIESETSSYYDFAKIDAQALVANGLAYALVENTKETDIYGLDATIAIENADGRLLDVCEINTGNSVGVFPQSTMVLRNNAEDYANDTYLTEGVAKAYVTYELD